MKILALVAASIALVVPQAAAKPGHEQPLMAVVTRGHTQLLTALDPLTLAPVARGKVVGREAATILARSPSGGRVAVLGDYRWFAVFDLAGGRVTRWIHVGESVVAGLWTRPRRLVLLDSGGGVYTVTLGRRTTLRWHPIDGAIASWATAGNRFVAVVAPRDGIGPARLAVANDTGGVRTVALPGVLAGQSGPTESDQSLHVALPGVAIDPTGRRAAIVQRAGPPLVVDLDTLAVAGRSLAVAQKQVSGYVRSATWFAPNLLAVTGTDGSGEEQWAPAGLTVVDLTTGSRRMVERGVSHALPAATTLLACGAGLSGYSSGGKLMFHALGETRVQSLAAVGPYAYASSDGRVFSVVDSLTGRVAATATAQAPTTIVGSW
jgi:hypothetical protein